FIRAFKGRNGRVYKREGIYSPISQNERQVRILEKILKKEKLIKRMPIKSYVILANPKTILHKKYAPKRVRENIYKYDQITQILKNELNVKMNMNVADKLLFKIANYLVDNHKPTTYDYSKYLKDTPVAAVVIKDEVVNEGVDKENIVKQLREYRMKMAKQVYELLIYKFKNKKGVITGYFFIQFLDVKTSSNQTIAIVSIPYSEK